jgi:hypothetical protein
MHYARAILRGEDVHAQWSGLIAPLAGSAVDNLLAQIDQHGERFMFAIAVPETLTVASGQMPLGSVLHIMRSTRIANLDEVQAWRLAAVSGSIDVQLEPGGNRDMTVRAAPANPPAPHDKALAS